MKTRGFNVLFHTFLVRLIDLELLARDADPSKLLGQLMTILAGLSLLFSLPLLVMARTQEVESWTFEHFFIATTITVTGLFSLLSWDSMFPDRRDVLVLGPLPVLPSTLFLAKLAALGAGLGLVIASLNIFTGLCWPVFLIALHSSAIAVLRGYAAYWITIACAGLFTCFSILCVRGLAATMLPRRLFLRVSGIIQVGGFFGFVVLYFLEPSLESRIALATHPHLLQLLPAYWFLGLFECVKGEPTFAFRALATKGLFALLWSAAGAVAFSVISYRSSLVAIVEEPELATGFGSLRWQPQFATPFQTAIAAFTARTLMRSQQHRLIGSFYLGAGGAAIMGYASFSTSFSSGAKSGSMVTLFQCSILFLCVAVLATRALIAMPVHLRAHWVFRITETRPPSAYMTATRKLFWWGCIAPVIAGSAIWAAVIHAPPNALIHLLLLGLLGWILVELSMLRFQSIPFTCALQPGRANTHIFFWCGIFILPALVHRFALYEDTAIQNPCQCLILLAIGGAVLIVMRKQVNARVPAAQALMYEPDTVSEVQGLHIR